MELQFIDCACTIGMPSIPVPRISYDKEIIKKHLKGLNIKKAYSINNLAVKSGIFEDNRLAKKDIEGDDFFLPSYTFIINEAASDVNDFERILKEDKIRVMNLNHAIHGTVLSEFYCGDYFKVLDDLEMTVTVTPNTAQEPGFAELASKYKNIRFVITHRSFLKNPDLYTLMKKLDNIYADISHSPNFALEELVKRFGSERFLFISHAPETASEALAGRLILSTLTDGEKENIAHKNIERITGVKLI